MALPEGAAGAVPSLTLVPGVLFQQPTPEVDQRRLDDRRAEGQDVRDQVCEGVYVVTAPAQVSVTADW